MMVDTGIRIKGRVVIFLDKQCIKIPKNFRGLINHLALLAF